MFTFCFTTVAATQLRRIREVRTSTRQIAAGVRAVKIGLIALSMLAVAGMAQAGGHPSSGSMGSASRNSGSNLFSQSNQFKMNQSNNKFDSNKSINLDKLRDNKPTAIDSLKNNGDKFVKTNKGIDPIKLTGDKNDKVKLGLGDKFKLSKGDKLKDSKNICDPCHDSCCHFHCCPWWYCWNYPCWYPMYGCSCGDWEDVPVVQVQGLDLQLLAVRTIDSGDPGQQLGPALRVWLRNNSPVTINHPFNVLALAARDAQPTADLPQAGVRIDSIEAGQTLAVDIRLPVEANQPGFPMFHVLVDSHREIPEVDETNNGLVINRAEVKPIEMTQAPAGGEAPAAVQASAPTTDNTPKVTDTVDSSVPLMMQGVKAE